MAFGAGWGFGGLGIWRAGEVELVQESRPSRARLNPFQTPRNLGTKGPIGCQKCRAETLLATRSLDCHQIRRTLATANAFTSGGNSVTWLRLVLPNNTSHYQVAFFALSCGPLSPLGARYSHSRFF